MTSSLWPFFTYYGGKWRIAPRYPAPTETRLVEPFAGSAGYALRYPHLQVLLIEKNPQLVALWQYLIRVRASEIRRLPLLRPGQAVADLHVTPEAADLIGFWCNKGTTAPCRTPSKWMRDGLRPKSFWGPEIRERIASQLRYIRHWTVWHGSYRDAPDVRATWFVDPPYVGAAGRHYRYDRIAFRRLGRWCRSRQGQVIVCEQVGATWLPFRPFVLAKANESATGGKRSAEAIWTGP